MKLIFFLVAFFLVSIRVFFSWSDKDKAKKGVSESNLVVRGENFYEELKYSGQFILTEDESAFKKISPGGHLKFTLNDLSLKAESNFQGKIEYKINDGHQELNPIDSNGKKIISDVVHQMIYWGFDAEQRLKRVFNSGGPSAILREADSMKTDNLKMMYLNYLLSMDSIPSGYFPLLTQKMSSLGDDLNKAVFLTRISASQLNKTQVADAYITILSGMNSDMDRTNAINHFLDQHFVSDSNFLKLIAITGNLGSDMNKKEVFSKMMDKHFIDSSNYDLFLTQISRMGADYDKSVLFTKIASEQTLSETQWASLINQVANLDSDSYKMDFLVNTAQKMPKTKLLKDIYLKAAKTMHDDYNYGRAVRAID